VAATTSGEAPGSCARTEMVGKSTCGRGATGSRKNASPPAAAIPNVSRIVAIGRQMKGRDGLMASTRPRLGSVVAHREDAKSKNRLVGSEPGIRALEHRVRSGRRRPTRGAPQSMRPHPERNPFRIRRRLVIIVFWLSLSHLARLSSGARLSESVRPPDSKIRRTGSCFRPSFHTFASDERALSRIRERSLALGAARLMGAVLVLNA
jgi:hypothetical protein